MVTSLPTLKTTFNRRKLFNWSFAGLAAVSLSSLWETACTWGSVAADILKYIPIGLNAFASIISLLTGFGLLAPGVAALVLLVKAAFVDLQTVIQQYDNAPAASKVTLLEKISTALAVVEADLQAFWSNLTIPDPQQATLIEGLLGLIISVLQGFGLLLPAPAPIPVSSGIPHGTVKRIKVTPQRRSPAQFRTDFNQFLAKHGHSEVAI